METEINFFAIDDTNTSPRKFYHYVQADTVTVFGSFTLDECAKYQGVTTNFAHTYFIQPIPCSRCGYTNHSIEKCVARRNVHRELILSPPSTPKKIRNMLYPESPSNAPRHNEVHYYNSHLIKNGWHHADKTDYNQFVFSPDEVQEWIEEEQQHLQPHYYNQHNLDAQNDFQVVYVPLLVKKHQAIVAPRFTEQQEIDYALNYNYAVTEYMLGRQTLFHSLRV